MKTSVIKLRFAPTASAASQPNFIRQVTCAQPHVLSIHDFYSRESRDGPNHPSFG